MSTFKDEMFKFITSEDNFESSLEIAEQMPEIKTKLINEFWDKVYENLQKLDEKKVWEINYEDGYIDIWLEKPNWDCYFTITDFNRKVYFGIYATDEINRVKAMKLLNEYDISIDWFIKKKGNLLCWKYQGDDFSSNVSLNKIIPSKLNEFAIEFANEYWEIVNEYKPMLNKINK